MELLQAISDPTRLEILLIVGTGEACVCNLETRLGYRQAYISQHLMALRQAELLEMRREGKYVFYRLLKPEIMPLIQMAADIVGVNLSVIEPISPQAPIPLNIPKLSLPYIRSTIHDCLY